MAQFRVVLDRVDLSDDQHRELDRALQRTTLAFLAGLDSRGDQAAYYLPKVLRPPLAGIWIREIIDAGQIGGVNDLVDLRSSFHELNKEINEGGGF